MERFFVFGTEMFVVYENNLAIIIDLDEIRLGTNKFNEN